MKLYIAGLFALALVATQLNAADADKHHPCKQIEDACKAAGFIKGDWKKGDGLWRDCIDPIMQGQTNVPGATKPLPTVDAAVVAACKAKRPNFGSGKVGSAEATPTNKK